eukprot:scaffold149794_cov40-Cyclotella_meneghiniana.AAC.2
MYRRAGSAVAADDANAKCLQIYFLDPGYQATVRARRYVAENETEDQRDVELFGFAHSIDPRSR